MTKEIKMPEMTYVKIAEPFGEHVRDMIRKAYAEGYEMGRLKGASDISDLLRERTKETPQQKRDRIVEEAKADIDDLKKRSLDPRAVGYYYVVERIDFTDELRRKHPSIIRFIGDVEFVINKEKRTVVALLKGAVTRRIFAKGIAKCAPDDCFNVHIGKAISLRRALGLEVPAEYLNAPQPTDVRRGDVMRVNIDDGTTEVKTVTSVRPNYRHNVVLLGRNIQYPSSYAEIIDDSREVSE